MSVNSDLAPTYLTVRSNAAQSVTVFTELNDVLDLKYLFHPVLYIRSFRLRFLCEVGSYFSHILPLLFVLFTGALL